MNELWDKSVSENIITIMKNGKYCEMIGEGIPDIYRETDNQLLHYIATKSGKDYNVRNDGGIVSTKYGDYILSIFISGFSDMHNLNDEYVFKIGRKISSLLFNRYIALKGKFD